MHPYSPNLAVKGCKMHPYIQVMGNGRTTVQRQTFVLKLTDKMPTLRKIKIAAS